MGIYNTIVGDKETVAGVNALSGYLLEFISSYNDFKEVLELIGAKEGGILESAPISAKLMGLQKELEMQIQVIEGVKDRFSHLGKDYISFVDETDQFLY